MQLGSRHAAFVRSSHMVATVTMHSPLAPTLPFPCPAPPPHCSCTAAHLAAQCAAGHALATNFLYILRYLLEKGAPPDARARGGNCPIHLAAAAGSAEAVKLLLHFKADAYVLNEQGLSPLQASGARQPVRVAAAGPLGAREWTWPAWHAVHTTACASLPCVHVCVHLKHTRYQVWRPLVHMCRLRLTRAGPRW